MQNVLAEHEMFEKFGGGETSKQRQAIETSSCQTNNVGQFRQAFKVHRDSFPKEKQLKEFKCIIIIDSTLQLRFPPFTHY